MDRPRVHGIRQARQKKTHLRILLGRNLLRTQQPRDNLLHVGVVTYLDVLLSRLVAYLVGHKWYCGSHRWHSEGMRRKR